MLIRGDLLHPGLPSNVGGRSRLSAYEAIQRCGLSSNLVLCLDAGDASSYTSGQSWLDRSGNGYDFFLGADGSSTATDPTFNGVAGAKSRNEYFSCDGGDYFTYDTTNEAWMDNLHKDNALFTLAAWVYVGSLAADQTLFSTNSASTSAGVRWQIRTTGVAQMFVGNGAVNTVLSTPSAPALSATTWSFVSLSLNEATGASGVISGLNARHNTSSSTYTSPSAAAAATTAKIGALGTGGSPLLSGGRIGAFMAWTQALTAAQLHALFQATRHTYGV